LDRKKAGEAVHILTLVINPPTGGDAILETHSVGEDEAQRALLGDMPIHAPHHSGDFRERLTEDRVERRGRIFQKRQ